MYRIDISIIVVDPGFAGTRAGGMVLGMMTLRPETLRGLGAGSRTGGEVDYRLARNSIVTQFQKGRLSRLDVCDAHPELLRAAVNVGDETREDCPICQEVKVRLVTYVFGSGLPPSGVCVTSKNELTKLSRRAATLACYVVEVCPNCSWNHLARSFAISRR
jgi:Family of unknown function (DUF5318)